MSGVFGCVCAWKLFSYFCEVCLLPLIYFPVVYFRFINANVRNIIDSEVHKLCFNIRKILLQNLIDKLLTLKHKFLFASYADIDLTFLCHWSLYWCFREYRRRPVPWKRLIFIDLVLAYIEIWDSRSVKSSWLLFFSN